MSRSRHHGCSCFRCKPHKHVRGKGMETVAERRAMATHEEIDEDIEVLFEMPDDSGLPSASAEYT